ncbi:MAG: hypothetical protein CMM26_09435 [Rhodospirillaceae bacterium]|nr:hypothetical protein [Rhodospirillaceae bacterium]
MAKHAVDGEMGFAGVGGPQNGFDGTLDGNGHIASIPTPATDCNQSRTTTRVGLRHYLSCASYPPARTGCNVTTDPADPQTSADAVIY